MKITNLTEDQQTQVASLKSAVIAAQTTLRTANTALQTYIQTVLESPRPIRAEVSEDGKNLISGV